MQTPRIAIIGSGMTGLACDRSFDDLALARPQPGLREVNTAAIEQRLDSLQHLEALAKPSDRGANEYAVGQLRSEIAHERAPVAALILHGP